MRASKPSSLKQRLRRGEPMDFSALLQGVSTLDESEDAALQDNGAAPADEAPVTEAPQAETPDAAPEATADAAPSAESAPIAAPEESVAEPTVGAPAAEPPGDGASAQPVAPVLAAPVPVPPAPIAEPAARSAPTPEPAAEPAPRTGTVDQRPAPLHAAMPPAVPNKAPLATPAVRPVPPSPQALRDERLRGALERLSAQLGVEIDRMAAAMRKRDADEAGFRLAHVNQILDLLRSIDASGDLSRQLGVPCAPPAARPWPPTAWSVVELAESPFSGLLPPDAGEPFVREVLYSAWGVGLEQTA